MQDNCQIKNGYSIAEADCRRLNRSVQYVFKDRAFETDSVV